MSIDLEKLLMALATSETGWTTEREHQDWLAARALVYRTVREGRLERELHELRQPDREARDASQESA